jgi:hypothetical protein
MKNLPQNSGSRPASWVQVYLAVALTTSATLLLELSLTRIFSVVFYYHFAFLAISIALFGLGVGGVLSYVVAAQRGALFQKLGLVSLLNAGFVLAALMVVLSRGVNVRVPDLALIYFSSSLPFLGAGIITSLVIADTIERVHRVYFSDLLGAAAGCIVLVVLLDTFGGENTVIAVAVLFAAAGAMWFNLSSQKLGRIASVGIGLAFALLIIANTKYHFVQVRYAKGRPIGHEQFVKWNPISRIGLENTRDAGESILIDADAATSIARFDFDHLSANDLHDLLYQGPGIPYDLRPGAKTLVIGPGGGWDVSRALASGSHDVTGVEINPIIANTIMRERFANLSNGLYLRPDVHIHVEDGRSFVRRSREKYQVIQATLVDTWAATAAGAFALSENNLYTTDAFVDYLSHLTDNGVLAFTRWGFSPPRESLRLVSLAIEALRRLGETDPARHVMVGREDQKHIADFGARDTVLISRKPFSDADIATARAAIAKAKMVAVYLPGDRASNPFGDLLLAKDPLAYERNYPFDITPVGDNRPFFFYTVQPRDIQAFLATGGRAMDAKINKALPMLFAALVVSIAAVAIILVLPPIVLGARLPSEREARTFLLYFIAIGIGYILIEVALIQKFVLFLGHPTYALTVVIFSMLISSGFGSFSSARLIGDRRGRLAAVLVLAAVAVCALALSLPPLLTAGVGLPLGVKVLLTVLLVAPAGFAMGMPFPTGLRLLEQRSPVSVRWAWSLNAAASVLGSVGALVLALYFGLVETMLIGAGLYLVALAIAASLPRLRSAPAATLAEARHVV